MEKLISMRLFVEQKRISTISTTDTASVLTDIFKYEMFLRQPLTLGMFVPCDLDGNVLEEPDSIGVGNEFYLERALDQYQDAKDRCLFEGFYVENGIVFTPEKQVLIQKSMLDKMNIEHLVGLNYSLSPTAQKQIGL